MSFQIEVSTPTGKFLSKTVDEIILPGSEGEFGVLSAHAGMASIVRPGQMRYRTGTEMHTVEVGSGFAKIGHVANEAQTNGETEVLVVVDSAGA